MTLPAELRAEAHDQAADQNHELAKLLHRAADALEAAGVIGECVEAGTDPETGDVRLIISATVDAIRNGPPLVYRNVKVTPLPATPEGGVMDSMNAGGG